MNWLSVSQEGDVCPICIDNYTDPAILPCNHNFCIECLKILAKKNAENKLSITCPLCEVVTNFDNEESLLSLPINQELRLSSDKKRKSRVNLDENDNLYKDRVQQLQKATQITIPKNFKLLQEYDASIGKDGKTFIPEEHSGLITYGAQEDDLKEWHAIIIGTQDSPIGQNIYNLRIEIPDEYPAIAPFVSFTSPRLLMPCVDDDGNVDTTNIDKVDLTTLDEEGMAEEATGEKFEWNPSLHIADLLVAIRENMHLRSVCNESSGLEHESYI